MNLNEVFIIWVLVIASVLWKDLYILEGNEIRSIYLSVLFYWEGNIEYIFLSNEIRMAHGLGDVEMKKEYFDSQQDLDEKLDILAKWIKESKHFIVFTGMFCK